MCWISASARARQALAPLWDFTWLETATTLRKKHDWTTNKRTSYKVHFRYVKLWSFRKAALCRFLMFFSRSSFNRSFSAWREWKVSVHNGNIWQHTPDCFDGRPSFGLWARFASSEARAWHRESRGFSDGFRCDQTLVNIRWQMNIMNVKSNTVKYCKSMVIHAHII